MNGNARADALVGADEARNNGISSGSAYVVFGPAPPDTVDLAALGQGGFRIDGGNEGDHAGGSVAGAGDVNGDGLPDLLVGAQTAGNHGTDSGSAYVVFGKTSPETVNLDTKAPTRTVTLRTPQRVLRQKGVIVHAACDEACTISASGTIAISGRQTRLALRRASHRLDESGQASPSRRAARQPAEASPRVPASPMPAHER